MKANKKANRSVMGILLCLSLLCTAFFEPQIVWGGAVTETEAEEGTGGLCEHHIAHDESCGFRAAEPGSPCMHEHSEECYKVIKDCVHEHTEECYIDAEDTEDAEAASPSKYRKDRRKKAKLMCIHECDEDCYRKVLICGHWEETEGSEAEHSDTESSGTESSNIEDSEVKDSEIKDSEAKGGVITTDKRPKHDAECGYKPPEEGIPCGYVCSICTKKKALKKAAGENALHLYAKDRAGNPLSDAGVALLRLTETGSDWINYVEEYEYWEFVQPNQKGEFVTLNKVENVGYDGFFLPWKHQEIPAVFTGNNAASGAEGELCIENIPKGRYALIELAAPAGYIRDFRCFYFTVGENTTGDIQLYLDVTHSSGEEDEPHTQALDGNVLTHYKNGAELALVLYDAEGAEPSIAGDEVELEGSSDGWFYTDEVLQDDNAAKGIEGAVYKLFIQCTGEPMPHPEETNSEDFSVKQDPDYDPCIAVGKTDADGILRLSEMKQRDGGSPHLLSPKTYYLVQVASAKGYVHTPFSIAFQINEAVFPNGEKAGLVRTASNYKEKYGLQLKVVDGSSLNQYDPEGIEGAQFSVKEGDKVLYFIPDADADGSYEAVAEGTALAEDLVFTGSDGMLTLKGLKKDTSYTFTETKAPEGFCGTDASGNPITVSLKTPASQKDGNVDYGSGEVYPVLVKQIANEPIRIESGNLTMIMPTFPTLYTGYTLPDPMPITILNSGGEDVILTSLIKTEGENFTIQHTGSLNLVVPAGGSNTSFTVQPDEGWGVGDHTATITAEYGNGKTVSATVHFVVKPRSYDDNGSGSTGSHSGGGSVSNAGTYYADGRSGEKEALTFGTWMQDEIGWWYRKGDGSYPKNEWALCEWNGKRDWYHFDERGYMQEGWFQDTDGRIYFLHNVSDNTKGRMYTGWNWIGGSCYFFETEEGNFLGHLYRNESTPDGYTVNESGAWIVDGVVQKK